jgi:hypothetical protein
MYMKKYLLISSSLVFVVIIFCSESVNIAHADAIGWQHPPCSGYSVVGMEQPTNTPPATCGFFTESITLDNLDMLSNAAYIWVQYDSAGTINFSIATSTSVSLLLDGIYDSQSYFAFAKNSLPDATRSSDPMSIISTITATSSNETDFNGYHYVNIGDGVANVEVINPSPIVQKGLMRFVVQENDPDLLGASALAADSTTTMSVIGGNFVDLNSLTINPFVQEPITSPITYKDFFYSPLGIYDGNDIVLYKSKEIDTLDDGSKKTIAFPVPSIDGVVPLGGAAATVQASRPAISTQTVTNPATSTTPVSQSWWSSIWCFITGFFARSC